MGIVLRGIGMVPGLRKTTHRDLLTSDDTPVVDRQFPGTSGEQLLRKLGFQRLWIGPKVRFFCFPPNVIARARGRKCNRDLDVARFSNDVVHVQRKTCGVCVGGSAMLAGNSRAGPLVNTVFVDHDLGQGSVTDAHGPHGLPITEVQKAH